MPDRWQRSGERYASTNEQVPAASIRGGIEIPESRPTRYMACLQSGLATCGPGIGSPCAVDQTGHFSFLVSVVQMVGAILAACRKEALDHL